MANDEHVALLKQGEHAWNAWRDKNLDIRPDLSHADLGEADLRGVKLSRTNLLRANLRGANLKSADLSGAYLVQANLHSAILPMAELSGADLRYASLMRAELSGADLSRADLNETDLKETDLRGADLSGANLKEADLREADLKGATLSGADGTKVNLSGADLRVASLMGADLSMADLSRADLSRADLSGALLRGTNLRGADLSGANLSRADLSWADGTEVNLSGAELKVASLVHTDLTLADLTGCRIHGVSAWGLKLERTKQQNLVITDTGEPEITVDNIEIAQFIYLMLHNEKIREVIDTIGKKAVLLLGRFTNERKAVLDALREELRKRNYLPILFDFDVPATRDITETVSLLARMARFIIADLTDPSSIPKELEAIVPHVAVPVQPLLEGASRPYAMFKDYWKYDWVLPVYQYDGLEPLLATLAENVIAPAEGKVKTLQERRRKIEAELINRNSSSPDLAGA